MKTKYFEKICPGSMGAPGSSVKYISMEDHSKLITKDNMYREICGMSWGEYCCKVLDRCEDGDDDSIRIDMEVSEKIESLYAEAEFEKITPEEGGDFIPSGGRTWRKK